MENQRLKVENTRLQEEINTVVRLSDGDSEIGMGDQSKKRGRCVTIEANAEDMANSNMEGRSEKRVRREV
jgi:hypothetical protein